MNDTTNVGMKEENDEGLRAVKCVIEDWEERNNNVMGFSHSSPLTTDDPLMVHKPVSEHAATRIGLVENFHLPIFT